jgi:hypothetical protein
MRRILMLLFTLSALLIPCVGCGGGRPDPRDRPDFVDDTDPDVTAEMLEPTGPQGAEEKPAAEKPAEAP